MVNWSDRAKADLRKIYDYIAEDSPYYAEKTTIDIVKEANGLEVFPLKEKMVQYTMDENIREIFVYSYRVIYHVDEERRVSIVTIVHTKRDISNVLDIPST